MAEIINLNQVRKRKARADKEKAAEANRLFFGRTKAEKQATRLEKSRAETLLDGHKRDKEEEDDANK